MSRPTNREVARRLADRNLETLRGGLDVPCTSNEVMLWQVLTLTNDAILALASDEYWAKNR